ncbi:general substrate transporter [Melanomma pulvis-pyrius CBS 109.77]|uniref:General substrate transporter n=1 Tax=Melanomma pulvis-pyrius CBS 109.77 TaxID=1314802 RepID=A0A6A6XUI4_9PLEO|nr:general substrate transporter [Melanomma pulvis-pyrius CBS 109.77]
MHPLKLFKKPPGYVIASILCSAGGLLFGIDTGVIGPVTVMEHFTKYVGNPSPTIHGLIVSSILIPAAISSFFAGKLADALGRPRGIAIGSFIFAVGAAIEAASVHIGMFIVGRVVEGIGEGLYLGTLVVYICEISPPRHRGALATGPQLLITLGLVTGFFTCYGTTNIESSFSWRLPFMLLACYSFLFSAAALIWLPASPRWLTLRGRSNEASAAWEKLGVATADQEKILDQFETSIILTANADLVGDIVPERTPSTKSKKKAQMLDVFSSDARPRLFFAVFLMGMQQLSGIDGVLYYAPILFQQAGLASNESKFLASGVSALVIFAVTIPATIWADGWGRRANTIFGGLGMASVMFLMGGLYAGNAVHGATGAGRWVVIVSIYIFAAIYSVSWGVGIKIYSAEIQPQRTRATATSMAHGSNWLSNFLVALVTPTLLAKTSYGAYFLFGGCTFLTAVVCVVFMPETRGRSLDEIEQAFHKSRVGGLKGIAGKLRKNLLRRRPTVVEA